MSINPHFALQRSYPPQPLDDRAVNAILDTLDSGIVVIDAAASLHFANGIARDMLAHGDPLWIRCGRLTLSNRKAQSALDAFLDAVQQRTEPDRSRTLRLRLERSSGLPPCQLLVLSIENHEDRSYEAPPLFAISVFEPYARRQISSTALIDLYGLTRAEAGVAASLFARCSIKCTAKLLNVSEATVKSHLKQVFQKCAVRTQAELLQLLALGVRTW